MGCESGNIVENFIIQPLILSGSTGGTGVDIYVTGGTYSNGTAIFTNNTGGTFSVTGFSISNATEFTGGTVTGATNFINGLIANTISATTYYNLPIDVYVTSGVYSAGTAVFTNNTGGTFSVSGFSSDGGDLYWISGSTGTNSIKAINSTGLDSTGNYSVAIGNATLAVGDNSFAEGYGTTSVGGNSHAEGENTTALGLGSHAEGSYTIAGSGGDYAHSEGNQTQAVGESSHTEGERTTAIGYVSHAGGINSIASGQTSFVHGDTSQALGTNTIVLGANITGATNNKTYVDGLNIKTLTGTSVTGLGIDVNGFVVSGVTSGSNFTGGTVTGDTNFTGGLTANTISATTYYNIPTVFGSGSNNNGGTISSGVTGYFVSTHSGRIIGWELIGATSGSVVFDIWKTSANILPTVANSITDNNKPQISNGVYSGSTNLGGWTGLTYNTGDKFGFNIDSVSGFTQVTLSIKALKG